jgi:Domain of unknown function (DUF4398)
MTPLRRITLSILIICVTQITGCAQTKPPLAEMDDAAHRVEAARAAGAPTYAPLELRTAQERLARARAAMKEEEYDQAAQFAEDTQVASDLALTKTRLGKVREKVDARARENAQLRSDLSIGADANQGGVQP